MAKKLLIIRFSSFGDIIHCRSILGPLKEAGEFDEIDWLIRKDLIGTLKDEPRLNQIISFSREDGLYGLVKLALLLRRRDYHIVYDAHNNVRSWIVRTILTLFSKKRLIIRPKNRWKRFLLFKLRVNKFENPFKAMVSYFRPIQKELKLSILQLRPFSPAELPKLPESYLKIIENRIILVPATAWKMKSWPVHYWKELVNLLPDNQFLILGGPQDKFCEDIKNTAPLRVINFAGECSLEMSCLLVANSQFVITADTGLQQVADLYGRSGISLMGPSAFGFTTMGSMDTLEVNLPCRPCSKDGSGACSQKVYQKCMVEITPEMVANKVREKFN